MREVLVENPNVEWENVGGLESIKQELKEAVEWPMKRAESFDKNGNSSFKRNFTYMVLLEQVKLCLQKQLQQNQKQISFK